MRLLSGILLICGVMSFLYGIMIWMIQSGSMFFAAWFLMGGFFLLTAIGFYTGVVTAVPVWFRTVILVILAIALAVFVMFEVRIASCFGKWGNVVEKKKLTKIALSKP